MYSGVQRCQCLLYCCANVRRLGRFTGQLGSVGLHVEGEQCMWITEEAQEIVLVVHWQASGTTSNDQRMDKTRLICPFKRDSEVHNDLPLAHARRSHCLF